VTNPEILVKENFVKLIEERLSIDSMEATIGCMREACDNFNEQYTDIRLKKHIKTIRALLTQAALEARGL